MPAALVGAEVWWAFVNSTPLRGPIGPDQNPTVYRYRLNGKQSKVADPERGFDFYVDVK